MDVTGNRGEKDKTYRIWGVLQERGCPFPGDRGVRAPVSVLQRRVGRKRTAHTSDSWIPDFDPRIGQDSGTTQSDFSNPRIAIRESVYQDVVN